jgi:putative alpha-1,2-mannosidase
MIKPGPDKVISGGQDSNPEWDAGAEIRGFSQTHESGTGGGPKNGIILIVPIEPSPLVCLQALLSPH